MTESLANLVARFRDVRVLVAGDAMLDHYTLGSVDRISPEAPVPILRVDREFDRVGGAANVAVNIVKLGGRVELACLVGRDLSDGRDPVAEHLIATCESMGLEVAPFRFLPCTIRKVRFIAGRQQVLRVDWEHPFGRNREEMESAANSGKPLDPLPLTTSAIDGRREAMAPMLEKCDVVLVSDYAKGMVDHALMEQMISGRKPVVVDPRPQHADIYHGVDLITPNRREALQILGLDPRLSVPGEELGARLRDHYDCDVLVTLGADGMCLVRKDGNTCSIPAHVHEVFDVTGAGDTVAACMALGLGAGLDLEAAARIANAAAGVVVGHIGTASTNPEELCKALAT